MERKLATIETITNLEPIQGADRIETASVKGWKVVVNKGQFTVNSKCVYCEVDSLLPRKPWSEFLFKNRLNSTAVKLKTIKLKGQISQGICFPLDILNDYGKIEQIENNLVFTPNLV